MQRVVLLLILPLLIRTEFSGPAAVAWDDWRAPAVFGALYGLLTLVLQILSRRTAIILETTQHKAKQAMRWWYRTLQVSRVLIVFIFYLALFVLGVVEWLQFRLGLPTLATHLLMLIPPLGMFVVVWWVHWPIEWQMHRASLLREIDEGRPIYPMPTRGAYVWSQLRHQLLIWLIPLIGVLVATDAVAALGDWLQLSTPTVGGLVFLAAVGLFALTPLMVRVIWDTVPMPDGPLRQRLLALCEQERVGIADLLLWRTIGGMINGAVIGVIPQLRYVLLTDGLVDQMPERHVEAVMAHELAHVRRRHLPWLAVAAIGTLGGVIALLDAALVLLERWGAPVAAMSWQSGGAGGQWDGIGAAVGLVLGLGIWFVVFGYISRRYERQADAFAVQHFARRQAEGDDEPQAAETEGRVTEEAVEAMAGALESLAGLNHIRPEQANWRHGSIQWRCDYLRTLVGRPIDQLPIDRQVRQINWGCLVLLLAVVFSEWQMHGRLPL
jgi:STE24 endopeptidase